jgi:hypothetical protein
MLGLTLWLAGCGCPSADEAGPVAEKDLPPIDGPNLFPFRQGRTWGYINRSGEVVIEPRFWWAEDFHDGRARVSTQNGETAFINPQGQIAFTAPESWEQVGHFSEGLAKFYDGKKWGYVDEQGKVAIEPQFDDARHFSEGLAAVNLGAELEVVDEPPLAALSIRRGGKWGFIDKTGRIVVDCEFSYVGDFQDGLAWVRLPCGPGGSVSFDDRRFYIDHAGKMVVTPPAEIDQTWDFHDGLAAVQVGDRWGFVDRQGQYAIPPDKHYQGLGHINDVQHPPRFRSGLARVHIGGTLCRVMDAPDEWIGGAWYYINRKGEIVHLYRAD